MTLFSQSWLANAVLTTTVKSLARELNCVLNIWRDTEEPALKAALDSAWHRIEEAHLAVRDAIDLIKEASK